MQPFWKAVWQCVPQTSQMFIFSDPLFPVIEVHPKEIIRGLHDAILAKTDVSLSISHIKGHIKHSFTVVRKENNIR